MGLAVSNWSFEVSVTRSIRFPVALPATIRLGGLTFGAQILNIAEGGVMLETTAPLLIGSKLSLHCGTIEVGGTVAWRRTGNIGVEFDQPLSEKQVAEQCSRSQAIELRRLKNSELDYSQF